MMDDLKFTARKATAFLPISDEVLSPPAPSKPTFRWPSFVCRYEFSEDYYTEGHTCELPVGHDGPHLCSLEWETRPADVCKGEGHVWGEWELLGAENGLTIPFTWSGWKVRPEASRRCGRCDARDYKGGERDVAFSDAIVRAVLG